MCGAENYGCAPIKDKRKKVLQAYNYVYWSLVKRKCVGKSKNYNAKIRNRKRSNSSTTYSLIYQFIFVHFLWEGTDNSPKAV